MNDVYGPIINALVSEGFHHLPEHKTVGGKELDFKITPYSLNTSLSFKFDSLSHLVEFLKMSQTITDEKTALLKNSLMELDIDPNDFFYVNFFEKGKEVEEL
ncbi:MAG TPA: hypothetical protein VFQ50_01010 [Flavobacterium sp.]|jgi:hypothetical protein|nr:hypothetical protein [Flavobacterium sp.]